MKNWKSPKLHRCSVRQRPPCRKCQDAFAQARSDCTHLLGEFSFLCDIVDGFLPLCNLARGAFTGMTSLE
ncbi:hypothetical protein GOODEAATRI_029638 [Goodea atripinnis]|uniref:Uncharacterized protein n=1 Tax=Goodea atripinnis TaxID=208336 RepID=A0ABV0P8W2_9TELE